MWLDYSNLGIINVKNCDPLPTFVAVSMRIQLEHSLFVWHVFRYYETMNPSHVDGSALMNRNLLYCSKYNTGKRNTVRSIYRGKTSLHCMSLAFSKYHFVQFLRNKIKVFGVPSWILECRYSSIVPVQQHLLQSTVLCLQLRLQTQTLSMQTTVTGIMGKLSAPWMWNFYTKHGINITFGIFVKRIIWEVLALFSRH